MQADARNAPGAGGRSDDRYGMGSRLGMPLISAVLLMQIFLLALGIMLFWLFTWPVASEAGSQSSRAEESQNPGTTAQPNGTASQRDREEGSVEGSRETGNASDLAQLHSKVTPLITKADENDAQLKTLTSKVGEIDRRLGKIDGASKGDTLNSIASSMASASSILRSFDDRTKRDLEKLIESVDDLTIRLGGLETLVSRANTREASAAEVIVIVCDTRYLPFKQYSDAYLSALLYNPDRMWFAKHRIGLWIARGRELKQIVPVDAQPKDTPELVKSIKSWEETNLVTADLNELWPEVFKNLLPELRPQTRVVLVAPAGSAAPVGGWDGIGGMDVLLVSGGRTVPSKEQAGGWLDFCASRNGLLAVIRPAPAIVAAVTQGSVNPSPGVVASSAGGQQPAPPNAGQQPAPPNAGQQPAARRQAEAEAVAGPPKKVIEELERELRRLIQPTSPPAPGRS
jgi:hypothetical protein